MKPTLKKRLGWFFIRLGGRLAGYPTALTDRIGPLKKWEKPVAPLGSKYPTQDDFMATPAKPNGHVVTVAKQDKPWRPNQSGGVITAEPDALTMARERGEDVDNN